MQPATRKRLTVLCLGIFLLTACGIFQPPAASPQPATAITQPAATQNQPPESTPTPTSTGAAQARPDSPQIGLNFIRFFWSDKRDETLNTSTPYYQPEWIFDDFAELGIHTYRQFVKADLLWGIIEPRDDEWHFEGADAVLRLGAPFEPIVTLFHMQYASPTPPWAVGSQQFEETIGPEAEEYLKSVVQRYADVVTYWEIGNEMNHWRAGDPGAQALSNTKLPKSLPADGFSPQEQGAFLAQAAALIRQYDPQAVILMPGVGGMDEYVLDTWLPGVIEGGGTEWFDIVNYHFYNDWQRYDPLRQKFGESLEKLGLCDKPVWLTETGVTSLAEIDLRTDYPNSPEQQAADIFRRIVQAYGHGDALVMWHTYISSGIAKDNTWAMYGIRTDTGEAQPSYYALKLLVDELIPFARVENLSSQARGLNAYRVVTQDGRVRYVVWGQGSFQVPEEVTEYTQVVPGLEGSFDWKVITPGKSLEVTDIPFLLR